MQMLDSEQLRAAISNELTVLAQLQDCSLDLVLDELVLAAQESYDNHALVQVGGEQRQRIRELIDRGQAIEIVEAVAQALPLRPVAKRPVQAVQIRRREMVGRLAPLADRVRVLGHPPTSFALGREAHAARELVEKNSGGLNAILCRGVRAFSTGDQVYGVSFGHASGQLPLFGIQVLTDGAGGLSEVGNVLFSQPFSGAVSAEKSIVTWALSQLKQSWRDLNRVTSGKLPERPGDVTELLTNEVSGGALRRVFELYRILLPGTDLSQVLVPLSSHDGYRFKEPLPLEALNLLAVARKIVEVSSGETVDPATGVLTELSLGVTSVDGLEIPGGYCDAINLFLPGSNMLPRVADLCERRLGTWEGGRWNRRRLSRDFMTLAGLVAKEMGQQFLEKARIKVVDFKFIGGDGGANTALDLTTLPVELHRRQVEEYLFLVACQMCLLEMKSSWTRRVVDSPLEGRGSFPHELAMSEALQYFSRARIPDRVSGELAYETPGRTQTFAVNIPGGDETEEWASRIMERKNASQDWRHTIQVLSALTILTRSRRDSVRTERIEKMPIPEEFAKICTQFSGTNYLVIENLAQFLAIGVDPLRAAYYEAENIRVLWLTGLDDHKNLFRLSADETTGKFSLNRIIYLKQPVTDSRGNTIGYLDKPTVDTDFGHSISGRLCLSRGDLGVDLGQRVGELAQRFVEDAWNAPLAFYDETPMVFASAFNQGSVVGCDGLPLQASFEGKPLEVGADPISGRLVYFVR